MNVLAESRCKNIIERPKSSAIVSHELMQQLTRDGS